MPMMRTDLLACVMERSLPHVGALLTNASAPGGAGLSEAFDVLITNGRVVDGTGAPWYRADVGIIGDRIAASVSWRGATRNAASTRRISSWRPASSTCSGQSEFNVLVDPRAASKITQGITTEITGEGTSIAPVNDALAKRRSRNATASRSRSTSARLTNTSRGSSAIARRSTSAPSSAPAACAPTSSGRRERPPPPMNSSR